MITHFKYWLKYLVILNMRIKYFFTRLVLIILYCYCVQAGVRYQFTFENDTIINGNQFLSNGAHITVSDMNTYIKIPEISSGPNARAESGMIQLDVNNNVDFDTHLNFASWTYYVGMSIYINYNQSWMQSHF